ncbi:MAG: DUF6169 family protein [Runella sp.]
MDEIKSLPPHYKFKFAGGNYNSYFFVTHKGIVYEVKFRESGYIFDNFPEVQEDTFEFLIEIIENPLGKVIPFDNLMRNTIAAILIDFFQNHQRVVVYVCDTSDARGVARFRKFNSWFETHPASRFFGKYNITLMDIDGMVFHASAIMRIDNPSAAQIITKFNELALRYQNPK